MTTGALREVVRHLRQAVPSHGASDAQLLERFVATADQDAFELLVWRHSGMVLGVCRRLLRHQQDAEDCFQAVFLALAREAGRISRRESVGGWLYRVACRVARRARSGLLKRASREQPLGDRTPPYAGSSPCAEAAWRELNEALDEQLARLPAAYREVFVLRCLAGKSIEQTARELRCPAGTVESRLARARQRLRQGLARRGLSPEAAFSAAPASVPVAWITLTIRAAARAAAGKTATGCIGTRAAILAEGVSEPCS
jgi:RNA polymerase sigma factor (sigma-70 family)